MATGPPPRRTHDLCLRLRLRPSIAPTTATCVAAPAKTFKDSSLPPAALVTAIHRMPRLRPYRDACFAELDPGRPERRSFRAAVLSSAGRVSRAQPTSPHLLVPRSCSAPAPLADRSTARGSRLCSQIAALLAPQTRLVAPEACRARRLPFKPRLLLSRGQAILAVDAMVHHHLPPTRLRPAWPRWHRAQRCVPLRSLSRSLARSLRASTWVHPPSNHSSQPTTPTNNA
eukprot:CAMPEP_0171501160 /NCGR_PEP_ID=MMETSP0958-20121227/9404_1 /TAXON_ID=87120 /ORGANISM="Aurantiochytrium limacinum, Strain ATCCMYA-1381" /LENGTH=228 /DNA_ID=CAMNT_0012035945 /DNA_START=899 /DNA_END=1582 /DNA_ORIENTATION=+